MTRVEPFLPTLATDNSISTEDSVSVLRVVEYKRTDPFLLGVIQHNIEIDG